MVRSNRLCLLKSTITLSFVLGLSSVLGYAPVVAFDRRNTKGNQHPLQRYFGNSKEQTPWIQRRFDGAFGRNNQQRIKSSSALMATKTSGGRSVGQVASAAALVLLDIACRRGFKHYQIGFPSSLGGCGLLFALLILLPKKMAATPLQKSLQPGADLLAKWLPVFFVPSLVTLPLSESFRSLGTTELMKLAAVISGGFLFTLYTTALSVVAIVNLTKKRIPNQDAPAEKYPTYSGSSKIAIANENSAKPPPKAFSDGMAFSLYLSTLVASAGTYLAAAAPAAASSTVTKVASLGLLEVVGKHLAPYQSPLQSLSLLCCTLSAFVFGSRMPAGLKKVVHPVVTCTSLTWAFSKGLGHLIGTPFMNVLSSYTKGSLSSLMTVGAGDVLLFLLGPAVVSLALSMYNRRQLIKDNFAAVFGGVSVATIGGLWGTAWAVQALALNQAILRKSLLSRNITSPLAMAITSICGGNVSLAVSLVVVTGLIGANFGASLLSAVGVTNPIARGLSMGAAAHGLGTASMVQEEKAFAFSAIGMALTASAATVAISVPGIREAVLKLALKGV